MFIFRICVICLLCSLCTESFAKSFQIRRGERVEIDIDTLGYEPVVRKALRMFRDDMNAILGAEVSVGNHAKITVRKDSKVCHGHKEAFRLQVSGKQLFLSATDSHGVAYGLLEISRLIGVSPWVWWADAKVRPIDIFQLPDDFYTEQSPSVEYRGIFINDEDWGLMPWASKTYEPSGVQGRIGPRTNERIFQLLLRLRANTYWPAMHDVSEPFFMTDGNAEVAKQYGIYIGTSHCEPMASNTFGEWSRRGQGEYNYLTNRAGVLKFWEDRVREVSDSPIIYTLGMRGIHDGAMNGAKTIEQGRAVLQQVFEDQRRLIVEQVNPHIASVPQVFIPYKEVLDIYNSGLHVPEDVCLMWCDDNYGYIHHFPDSTERQRSGGNGVYYHVSYWGRPHDYLWLGTFSPALLYYQMSKAYNRDIRRMWILNVGDIKPAEYQTELFMDMAWDIQSVTEQGVEKHLRQFLCREFGTYSEQILPLLLEHYRLAFIRKPEFLGGTRTEEADNEYWSAIHDMPWSESYIRGRIADYDHIEFASAKLFEQIEADRLDEYFQLVHYPIAAASQMNKKILHAQLARYGCSSHQQSVQAYDSILHLTTIYNDMQGGKWRYIMNHQPRQQTVFMPIAPMPAERSCLPKETRPLAIINGADLRGQGVHPLERLGYDGNAAAIDQGCVATFRIDQLSLPDSITISICLLPNHSETGKTLRFSVHLESQFPIQESPLIYDIATHGRSEEWKQNVLANHAVRQFTIPSSSLHNREIGIQAIDDGIVVDQIIIEDYVKQE